MMAKANSIKALIAKTCVPCDGGTKPMTPQQIKKMLALLPDWRVDNGELVREFEFLNFYQTMDFVNAVAWMANMENHHPDLEVGYSRCRIRWSTHAISGLSQNDFICAAKINAMLEL
ncbi:MAG: 4a-hydroxytetrahydrobiopterin dehydratase [Phycisphaerae bacterium]